MKEKQKRGSLNSVVANENLEKGTKNEEVKGSDKESNQSNREIRDKSDKLTKENDKGLDRKGKEITGSDKESREKMKKKKENPNNKELEGTDKSTKEIPFNAGSGENHIGKSTAEGKAEAVEQNFSEDVGRKKKSTHKLRGIILCILLLTILGLGGAAGYRYYEISVYYQTHFFPNTTINGVDCGNMEVEPVIAMLDAWMEHYILEVTGRDYKTGASGAVLGEIKPDDIELVFTGTREAVWTYMSWQEPAKWIQIYFDYHADYTFEQGISYNEKMLEDVVKTWEACQKGNMLKAENAYVSPYSHENNRYEIIPETVGTELDVDKVIGLVHNAVRQRETVLELEGKECYRTASVLREDITLNQAVDTANKWLETSISYDWNGAEIKLDYELLRDWISMGPSGPVLDEEAVTQFVKKQASEHDTYGKWRNFVTALGIELLLPSGYYGWKTDVAAETEELIGLIYQGSVIKREPVYNSTAKKKGMSDIGNSYVEADLTHQHLYLYKNGSVVLETDFVSGSMSSTPDCVTPPGVFGLSYKTTNAVLRGAGYQTPVNYWMPFYGNYGMHDATWRSEFGGSIYIADGSHGCINLPLDMAAQIYQYVSAGFPVICYYYEVDPLAGQEEEEGGEESNENWEDDGWDDSEDDWNDNGDDNNWEDDQGDEWDEE